MKITKENLDWFLNKNNLNIPRLRKVIIPKEHIWCNRKSEYWYAIKSDILEPPKCGCGNRVTFRNIHKGYSTFCSQKCSANDKRTREKCKETCLREYGVENIFLLDDFSKTSKEVKLERYGDENYNNREQSEETCLKTYGVPIASESEEVKNKISESSRNHEPEVILKKQETCLKNHGRKCGMNRTDPKYLQARGKATARGLKKFYQNGSSEFRFLYVLESKEKGLIKIGISSEMEIRLKNIQNYFSDTMLIHQSYWVNASDIETYLQDKFLEFNLVQEVGLSGRTEWFDINIKDKLLEEIEEYMLQF